VESLALIETKISSQTLNRLRHGLVVVQINLFVFDASPEPFNEDVVQCAAATVHADLDLALFENSCKSIARELRALISVEDLWATQLKGSIERAQAKVVLHRRGNLPTEHIARVPINDRDQVDEAGMQTNLCDIRAPDLIHTINLHPTLQVRVNLMPQRRER